MSKIFHRKSKMNNLHNIVDPSRQVNQIQESMQEANENVQHELNVLTKGKLGEHFRTIQRIKSYPIVQETQKHMDNCVVTRVFIANTEPVLVKVMNSKPLQMVSPVTNFLDKISYSSLRFTEKLIPSIKTKTFKKLGDEIMIPIERTKVISKRAKTNIVNKGDKYVYKPAHSKVIQFRKYYNEKFYDTKGKPIVRGAFDPVILPLNNAFENSTHKYFPQGKTVNGVFSCEFDRSVALSVRLIQNLVPLIETRTKHVMSIPFEYTNHVNSVINKHLDMEPNLCFTNSAKATYGSIIELYHEFCKGCKKRAPLKYFMKKDFNEQVQATVRNPISVVEESARSVAGAVTNTEEALVHAAHDVVSPPHEIVVNVES